jgi:hypothetical protein
MTTLVSLVGEQPMPILLPARHLKPQRSILIHTPQVKPVAQRLQRMIPFSELLPVDAYNLERLYRQLTEIEAEEIQVNLTGGTKIMSLAAFYLADQHDLSFCYLESERHRSLLTHYRIKDGAPIQTKQETLPVLITAADYLDAHLPGFREGGVSQDPSGGGSFETTVKRTLESQQFEVLAGVRPQGVADQIEIDLVIRAQNQVGIAEVKLGGDEKPKQGIDQLSTAGSREYLGTYTAKFLIVAGQLKAEVRTLAYEKQVTVIELPAYRQGRPLPKQDVDRLHHTVREKLLGIKR